MDYYWYLLAFAIALVATLLITPLTIKLATRFDIIDYPNERRINSKPTPRLGGVAIALGIAVSLGVMALVLSPLVANVPLDIHPGINYLGVGAALLVIFAVGLIDDICTVRVRYKLLGQILAATIACFSGVLFDTITNPFNDEIINIGWIAYPITIIYLIAFANIINLIDGLDGLAAGIVAIAAAALFTISIGKNHTDTALVTIAIAGACIAFLRYNSHPARVFMGDSGALTLGFLIGLVSLFGVSRTPTIVALLVPIVIAGIPVIDTFSAIVRRIRLGESVVEADTSHIHHRLMNIGYDQRTTAYVLYVLTGLLSLFALLIIGRGGFVRLIVILLLFILVAALMFGLKLTEPILRHYFIKRPRKKTWRGKSFKLPTTRNYALPSDKDTNDENTNED